MLETALALEVVDLPEETFAYVTRRVAPDEIGEFVRGGIARVAEFAEVNGGPQGPPMSITGPPDESGSLLVEAGWPVTAGTDASPPVEVRVLPATRAVRHRHVGPYEELGAAFYAELFSALHDRGLKATAGPRERYLNDPAWAGPPVTEIVWPVA